MKDIPVIGMAAYSGTGKTTLLTRVVALCKERGLRVAVIKHDAHGLDFDREGKDSWRYTQAGADQIIMAGPHQTVAIEQREKPLHEIIDGIQNVDIIMVEGFKNENIPQIGICRKDSGKGFTAPLERYVAVATDLPDIEADIPVFALNDVQGITDFIIQTFLP